MKVRLTSYCYAIPDVLDAAAEAGFEVEEIVGAGTDGVLVRGLMNSWENILGTREKKKWVGVRVWSGVCFVNKG